MLVLAAVYVLPDHESSGSRVYADSRLPIESVGEGSGGAMIACCAGECRAVAPPTGRRGILTEAADEAVDAAVDEPLDDEVESGQRAMGFFRVNEPTGFRKMLPVLPVLPVLPRFFLPSASPIVWAESCGRCV